MNDYDTILESIDAHMGAISKQVEALKILRLDSKTCIDVLYTRKEAADFIGRSLRQFGRLCAEGRIRRTITRDGLHFRKRHLMEYQGYVFEELDSDGYPVRSSKSELERLRENTHPPSCNELPRRNKDVLPLDTDP